MQIEILNYLNEIRSVLHKAIRLAKKLREYIAISPFACILTITAQIEGLKPTSPVEPQMKQWQTDDSILLCNQETPQ